jgi:hypothetical protein
VNTIYCISLRRIETVDCREDRGDHFRSLLNNSRSGNLSSSPPLSSSLFLSDIGLDVEISFNEVVVAHQCQSCSRTYEPIDFKTSIRFIRALSESSTGRKTDSVIFYTRSFTARCISRVYQCRNLRKVRKVFKGASSARKSSSGL